MRVVLPQLRPALLGGMLLVALGVLSEFGAFTLLRFRTFTTQIYAEYRTSFDSGGASLLACILIVICLVCLAFELRVRGAARYERVDRGTRRAVLRYDLGAWRWLVVAGLCALAIVDARRAARHDRLLAHATAARPPSRRPRSRRELLLSSTARRRSATGSPPPC